jgi:hypothetical protein
MMQTVDDGSPCHKPYKKRNAKKKGIIIEGTTKYGTSCNTPPLTTSRRDSECTQVEIQKHKGTTQVAIAIEH